VELNEEMKKETLKNFLLSAFFAVLTSVGGMLSIPIPFVPLSMQSFFVLMSGLLLGPKYGPLSQVFYIAMGLIGLPVFAGGAGGMQHVLAPSFGFLIGFVFSSWVAGLLAPKVKTARGTALLYIQYVLVCLAATVALFVVALPCFYLNMRYVAGMPVTVARTLELALLPFLAASLIKAVLAGGLACKTIPMLSGAGLLPKNTDESIPV
jgi:biotin transport system substrate-specific component